ncbi:MAG TPA: substrate-binding domain-containing protein [Verrucomicrobiae bacterium]|nr:substrate-binding domain-containing protein [Verrucomicrobiae bacterium]
MKRTGMARGLVAVMAAAIFAAACTSGAAPSSSGGGGAAKYTIGFSNPGGVGNGWREAMLCSAKAQAVKTGEVSKVTIIHRNTDAAGQLADIRTLIAQNVNAIIINPADPDALNPGIAEAIAAKITVIAVDASVTAPGAYNLSNDQQQYAYLGATWLFKALNGKGAVIYMRGIAGHPADTDRDVGFKKALAENPGITVAKEVATKWDPATATTQINDILSSGLAFDGIWTSGVDQNIVDALKTAKHPYVPIVGADNAGFVTQLLKEPGLKGAAVTNPPSVGGAGVTLATQILDGKKPASNTVHVTPVLWDNTTDAGKASLTAAADPKINPLWPLGLTIDGWTTYTKDDIIACKGPGE